VQNLVSEYVASQSSSSDVDTSVSPYYRNRLNALSAEIAQKKLDLEKESPEWTVAQQHRHIATALKNLRSLTEGASLESQSGLTGEMKDATQKAHKWEYAKSAAWAAAIELPQIGFGWAVGGGIDKALDIKGLTALAIVAGSTKAASLALLAVKGYYTEGVVKRTGVAPDPFSKLSYEKLGRAWPGFVFFNGAIELLFAGEAALGIPALGWAGTLSIDSATTLSPWGIWRQIGEDLGMRKAKKKGKDLTKKEMRDKKKKQKPGIEFNINTIKLPTPSEVSANIASDLVLGSDSPVRIAETLLVPGKVSDIKSSANA
jgi:hypothetical protein